jgi:hypothetical protein
MVDITQSRPQARPAERSRRETALERIREASAVKKGRVEAVKEGMSEHLRHPSGANLLRGVAEWPLDAFTMRRIRDGDIVLATDQRTTR